MLLYSLLPLLTGLTILAIGCFVLWYRPNVTLNRTFFGLCFSVFIWSLGYSVLYATRDERLAVLASRFGYLGVVFIPSTTLHFISDFTSLKAKRPVSVIGYAISFIFFICVFSNDFIKGMALYPWGLYPKVGHLYGLFIANFAATFSICVAILFLALKRLKKNKELSGYSQTKCVFFAFVIASFSLVDYLPNYGIEVYPFGYLCALGWISFISYAITRHRLMDISVIVKKTLIFAGLLAFVFLVFSAATLLVREVLSTYLKVGTGWTYAISLFLIVLGYDHIRNLLINLTDKYLFQKKYDYQKFLKEASRGMSRIKSLEHLLNLVTHFVTMKMRVENAGVLMRTLKGDFTLLYQRGYGQHADHRHIAWDHPLIQYFTMTKEAIDVEQAKERQLNPNIKVKGKGQAAEFDYEQIRLKMAELKASCCIPSFLGMELRNILVLGGKKSGDYFTEEDHNVLLTLAQESAIAIENARLYDEQVNKTRELEKINVQLESAKGSLLGALQETELANKRLQDTQAQLIHEQKMATLGRLAASVGHEVNNPLTILSMNVSRAILKYRKNPEAKIFEILEIFTKMEQNINRIKAVVNTLTGLLKKSEKGKFEPLSLKLILEETLPLVQFQTYLDNLAGTEVEFIVPGSIPLIRGDLERLQEVFLNLFINAYHAMEGRPNPKITVTADVDPENKFVGIHFTDTGKGMTEETAKRIFNYGFTTKPAGKGSGLGLYMCKYIIELHGGDIKVASEVDVGTTFTLTLPVFEESGTNFAEQESKTL